MLNLTEQDNMRGLHHDPKALVQPDRPNGGFVKPILELAKLLRAEAIAEMLQQYVGEATGNVSE